MAGPYDLTGQNIENTYQRVIQTPDGITFYDGTGSLVTFTATATAGGSNTQIQFNSASLLSGSSNFTFDYANNSLTLTGSLNVSGSTTQVGNNNLLGNTFLSGSIIISGAYGTNDPTVRIYGDTTHDGYIRFDPVSTNIDTSISASYIYVSGSTNDLYFSQNGNGYNNVTRLRWIEGNLYTGLLHGGLITSASSTTFNISSGSGIVVTLNATLNQDPYPTIKFVEWGNLTNQTLTYRTTNIQTFLGIDSNGNIIQQTEPWVNGQYNESISLGTVLHQNLSTINGSISYPNVAYGWKQRSYDFIKAFGPLKITGYAINTSSSLGLTVGSGTAFADGRNYQIDPNEPSYITDNGTNVSKIFRYYQSGSSFVQNTNAGVGFTEIDPTNYNPNNSGSLAPVPGGQYTVQRIFWYPNSVTKAIVAYYGNTTYNSITNAVANYIYENFNEVENTKQNAIYLGAIIIKSNGSFTTAADYQIITAGLFRSITGGGGGGSGTTSLASLSDVSLSSLIYGDLLMYNASTGLWNNTHTLSGSYTLSGSLVTNDGVFVQTLTASFVSASGGITGSLFGTSSWALNALTASYTPNAIITASVSSNTITFTKGNGSTFPITIDTGSGGTIGPGVTDTLALWNSTSTITSSSITTQLSSTLNSNLNVNNISPASNYIEISSASPAVIKRLDLANYSLAGKSGCYGMILDFNILLCNNSLLGDQNEFTYDNSTWPVLDRPYYVETGRIYLSWLGADPNIGGAVGVGNTVTYLTMNKTIQNASSFGWDEIDNTSTPSKTSLAASEEGVVAPYGAPIYRDQDGGYQFGYKLVNDPNTSEWYVEVAIFNDGPSKMFVTHTTKILTLFANP